MRDDNVGASKQVLTECDREAIHLISHVQSFGCQLCLCEDGTIARVSENSLAILGHQPADLIGRHIDAVLPQSTCSAFRHMMRQAAERQGTSFSLGLGFGGKTKLHDVSGFLSGDVFVFEIEPAANAMPERASETITTLSRELNSVEGSPEFLEMICKQVKALSGYDRVMVYVFDTDGCGEVAAEALDEGQEPFLGLRYPASDIPAQARALFRRKPLRMIADVNDTGVPITPKHAPDGSLLDLSDSTLRLPSLVHLEYLKNMGVGATLTISLICNGELHGLIACHNRTSQIPSLPNRSRLELYGFVVSTMIEGREAATRAATHERIQDIHHKIARVIVEDGDILTNIDGLLQELSQVIDYDGHAVWLEGQYRAGGSSLTQTEFQAVMRFLNTTSPRQIFCTDCLSQVFTPAEAYATDISGMLAIPISRSPRDYLVLFRKPIVRTVVWAGDPTNAKVADKSTGRMSPRRSFAAWQELKSNTSKRWSERERALAESVRITLLEVILCLTDASLREQVLAKEKQSLLIAELNHRVRNILTLIKSLVEQSGDGAQTVTDFTKTVSGRIHALAAAHDLITREAWGPTSLLELISVEIQGFTDDVGARFNVTGPDVRITPQAATTMALVLHELVTNATKYGALRGRHGQVSICITVLRDYGLRLDWREMGGPTVKAPTQTGFGSTLILEAVPHEFGGTADVSFELSGLSASFMLPSLCLVDVVDTAELKTLPTTSPALTDGGQSETSETLPQSVLLVEDMLLLAKGTKLLLEGLGVSKVTIVGSVTEALAMIHEQPFDCAILDYNLSDETSEPIARALTQRQIPVAILTGYDPDPRLLRELPDVVMLTKPVDREKLRELLSDMMILIRMRDVGKGPEELSA